jgi:cysteine desulfurase
MENKCRKEGSKDIMVDRRSKREVYLDNAATTKPYDEVLRHMYDVSGNSYGNPSSLHMKGLEAERLLKDARRTIAQSLGVPSGDIYFTSGGTESNNLAIRGFLAANPRRGRRIITSKIEHPSVMELMKYLSDRGYQIDYVDVDSLGYIDLDMLEKLICEETALISIMHVNNETGTIQKTGEIARLIRRLNLETAIHTDAVQSYGKQTVKPLRDGIDMVSLSSHKIHGPKGVGALYAKKGMRIAPLNRGGGQEGGMRSGTENIPGICGFAMAADMITRHMDENAHKISELREMFIKSITKEIEGIKINSPKDASVYILNISISGIKAEVMLHHLEREGVYVSTQSACSSKKNTQSHVLKAIGLSRDEINSSLRISFSEFNSEEDIEYTVNVMKKLVNYLCKH